MTRLELTVLVLFGISITAGITIIAMQETVVKGVSYLVWRLKLLWDPRLDKPKANSHRLGVREDQYYVLQRQYVREILNQNKHREEVEWRAHA